MLFKVKKRLLFTLSFLFFFLTPLISNADGNTVYLNGIVETPYSMPITVSVYNHDSGQLVDEYIIDKESKWIKEIYLPNGKYDFYAELPSSSKNQAEQLKYYEYTREVNGKDFTVDFMEGTDFFINKNSSKLLEVETPTGTPYVTGSITRNEGKELARKLAESQTGDSPDNEGYVESEIDSRYDNYEERSQSVFNGEFYEGIDGSGKNFIEVETNSGDINNLSEDLNKEVEDINPSGESSKTDNDDIGESDEFDETKDDSSNQQEDVDSKEKANKASDSKNKRYFFIIPIVLIVSILLFLIIKNRR